MRNSLRPRRRDAGFTLVEILVALAVIAIGTAAAVAAVSGNVGNAAYIQDRTLAHWVAMNKVAELQVAPQWPNTGTQRGDSLMASQEWNWEVKVSDTDDPDVRRVDVRVFADKDQKETLATLVAYVGRSTGTASTTGIGGTP
jgi:general secretion pathway protein I